MVIQKEEIFNEVYNNYSNNLIPYLLTSILTLIVLFMVYVIVHTATFALSIFSAFIPLVDKTTLNQLHIFNLIATFIINFITPIILVALVAVSASFKNNENDVFAAIIKGLREMQKSDILLFIIVLSFIASILSFIGFFIGDILYGIILSVIVCAAMIKYSTKQNPKNILMVFDKVYKKDNISGIVLYIRLLVEIIPYLNSIGIFLIPLGVIVLKKVKIS